jgi:hypothetical protein
MRAASIRHRPACIAVPDPVRLLTQAAIEKPPFANPPTIGHKRGRAAIPIPAGQLQWVFRQQRKFSKRPQFGHPREFEVSPKADGHRLSWLSLRLEGESGMLLSGDAHRFLNFPVVCEAYAPRVYS